MDGDVVMEKVAKLLLKLCPNLRPRKGLLGFKGRAIAARAMQDECLNDSASSRMCCNRSLALVRNVWINPMVMRLWF